MPADVASVTDSSAASPAFPLIGDFLEEFLKCQVCCTNYNETTKLARGLHCGHTFCTECIKTMQKYGNSAYLECPSCRAETKCDIAAVSTNFAIMELIRKCGFLGPEKPEEPPMKQAAQPQLEQTIDELIDEGYRLLIADVKADLMAKFEQLRDVSKTSTIEATKADLEVLCDSVKEAVYEADLEYSYDEEESDEDEEENEDEEDVEEEEEKPCAEKKSPAQPERSSSLVRGFQIGLSRLFRNRRIHTEHLQVDHGAIATKLETRAACTEKSDNVKK